KQSVGLEGRQTVPFSWAMHRASQQAFGDRPGSHCSPESTTPLPHKLPTSAPPTFSVPPVHAKLPLKPVLAGFAVAFTDSVAQSGALAPLTVNAPVPVSMVPVSENAGRT